MCRASRNRDCLAIGNHIGTKTAANPPAKCDKLSLFNVKSTAARVPAVRIDFPSWLNVFKREQRNGAAFDRIRGLLQRVDHLRIGGDSTRNSLYETLLWEFRARYSCGGFGSSCLLEDPRQSASPHGDGEQVNKHNGHVVIHAH